MNPVAEHRLGSFQIRRDFLANWPALVPLMSKMVVVDARFDYARDTLRYVAFSPLFEIIGPGQEAPDYDLVIDEPGGEIRAFPSAFPSVVRSTLFDLGSKAP